MANPETNKPTGNGANPPLSIVKPADDFDLDRFRSTQPEAAVKALQTVLPHYKIAAAKDYVRLHPDKEIYWSHELCFVNVPVKGQKKDSLHLILEELALEYLPPGKIQHFSLALATKPYDVFFLCAVPTRNLIDNVWNSTNLQGCELARTGWHEITSRREEGEEGYRIKPADHAHAFPEPKWPEQSLNKLIGDSFGGCLIDHVGHPALDRLRGRAVL